MQQTISLASGEFRVRPKKTQDPDQMMPVQSLLNRQHDTRHRHHHRHTFNGRGIVQNENYEGLLNQFELKFCRKMGWLYGMEMDSYKSQILDGVLVQKRNCTSRCLKLHASASQFFGTKRTHSCGPGLKGEALFSKLPSFFGVSADRRLERIRT
jgi:hypothetical protein